MNYSINKMQKYAIFSILFVILITSCFGYYQYYNNKQIGNIALLDSNRYYDTIFSIQNIDDLKNLSVEKLQNLKSNSYTNLSKIIIANRNFLQKDNVLDEEIVKDHINNKDSDKLIKDLTTMIYGKILLNQSNLGTFQKYIIPEISSNSFSFHANGKELINIYYVMNKEYELVKINDINFNDIPKSLKIRLQAIYQEAKLLKKDIN